MDSETVPKEKFLLIPAHARERLTERGFSEAEVTKIIKRGKYDQGFFPWRKTGGQSIDKKIYYDDSKSKVGPHRAVVAAFSKDPGYRYELITVLTEFKPDWANLDQFHKFTRVKRSNVEND